MGEVLEVALAKIVESGLPVAVVEQTVLGAFAIAGKQKSTLMALTRQPRHLSLTKRPLLLGIHHGRQRLTGEISQPI